MAEYVHSEAEESDDEGDMTVEEKKRLKKLKMVQDEDDDEEDEDDQNADDLKDLIDDEEQESESDESEIGRKRKNEDDDDYDDRLEDDDYDLIEENLGVKVQRRQFKRVRRVEDDESDEEDQNEALQGPDDEREAIANELFEGSEEEGVEKRSAVIPQDEQQYQDLSESEGEYSDTDGFIVDDEGQPITKTKRKRPRYTDAALQEAQDIFGVDFDYNEFERYGEDYDEELDEDMEYEEEEADGETRPRMKKAARKKPAKKTIFEVYEPSELERGHFTDKDNEIRMTDVPERFQLREIPVTATEEGELEEETEWIYKQAFCTPTISKQDRGQINSAGVEEWDQGTATQNPATVDKIREALNLMRNQLFEVPFIAFYRKEYVEPEMDINDLWKVYKWDEKWCQLKTRRKNLSRLFQNMQNYQCDEIMKDPEKPLADDLRVLSDEDIERLKSVQTMEELRDAYLHFVLYYGKDIPKMHESIRKKRQEERREKRRSKKRINEETGEEREGEEEEEEPGSEDEEDAKDDTDKLKQAVRIDGYALCLRSGIGGLAKKFGLTPQQFGENMRDNYTRHEVEQYPVEPLEVAQDYVCNKFPTPEAVLKAARFMVATQLSLEPLVRQCVRSTYFERAKMTIRPTKKGTKEIDENHPCYSIKYLKNKPVKDLHDDMFLRITMAEEEGLLAVTISMEGEGRSSGTTAYLDEIKQLYYRDEFSKNVQEWNEQRAQVLEFTLTNFLYPVFLKELRFKLLTEAKECVTKACSQKLCNWLKVAPFAVDGIDDDDDDYDVLHGIRVMSIAYIPDWETAAFCALVSGDSEVTDFLKLPHILKKKNAWRQADRDAKIADLTAIKRFIEAKKPHVIVVGAESRDAVMIVDDLKAIVAELVEQEQMPSISVELMDNELATVYMKSKKSEADFRDYPPLLRQAISLARRLQDPLIEFSQLCGPDEEILCLKYHSLQDHVAKEDLLAALFQEFINRTNEVGVDVNRAIAHPHTANLVQFVCGLGPRKAAALLKVLKQSNSRLENRTQLVTTCHLGPRVVFNTAGFIRIDTSSLGDSTEAYVEVLDGSRVHPEAYEWARKMAVDALEYDEMAEDANPAGALEEILDNPEKLKDLDLDAFAEELERQGFGNKSITLYDIRGELNHRYKDLRVPYRSPSMLEKFNMLTKESPDTFYIGKLVLATVVGIAHKKPQGEQLDQANPVRNEETGLWQCPFCLKNDFLEVSEVWNHFDAGNCPGQAMGVRVRLDNGVSGFILTKNISDKHVTNPEERVRVGMSLHCRITKIDIDRFQVDLTCRSSDLADKNGEWRPPKDPYYDEEAEDKDRKAEEDLKKKQSRQTYIKRVIVHPAFHNIDYKDTEKLMANMDQGEVIVRPSSKGADHLTVTWKVTDGIYQHIDVREEGKENTFSLGQSLWINNEEFEDLDEIIARHVQPMAAFARDLLGFKYFRDTGGGKKEVAEKLVIEEKKRCPSKIPYFVTSSKEYPGKFMLSYLPRNKCRHEFITVTPEGFRFRQQIFHSHNSLFRWFKEHFRDPVPGTPGSVSGRTPMIQSAYTTPSINIANLDPQTIQRAAANIPNHLYNTLSQVASQTPSIHGGHYSGYSGYGYPQTPIATPLITPSYHSIATPSHSVATPRYQPTPQWAHPSQTPRTPSQRPVVQKTSSAEVDWGKAAEMWAKRRQQQHGGVTPRANMGGRGAPRPGQSPAVRGTPMIESTPAGDATPLIDEH